MKKLSRFELDVVVNEVVNSIKLIEEVKGKELFEKSNNKDKFNEDGLRVFYNCNRNSYGNNEKLFSINCNDSKGNNWNLYKDVEKEIILNSLEELNIKELIKDLIEKFK